MKKDQTISKLQILDNAEFHIPETVVIAGKDEVNERVLLEITKPSNGSYLMKIKSADGGFIESKEMNADQLFEAWMVMGHTIKHLVSSYKKELIEYMVKEYRTREQLEKENEKAHS